MIVGDYTFPDDLYYDRNHFWVRVEDGSVLTGVTEFTAKMAGEITYVEMPEEDEEVTQGKPMGSIESGKWVGRAYAAMSGEVVAVNEEAVDEPHILNEDPYGIWLLRIKPKDLDGELANLMRADDALKAFIESELARLQA